MMAANGLEKILTISMFLVPFLTAVITWIGGKRIKKPALLNRGTFFGSLLTLIITIFLADQERPIAFRFVVSFYVDALSIYFVLLVNVVTLVASIYISEYLTKVKHSDTAPKNHAKFHAAFNFFHFTMIMVPLVDNLVVLWIAVELTTLTSTYLVAYRRDRFALEAAWKYLITTSTGIIFALLGTLFLAGAILVEGNQDAAMNWSKLIGNAAAFDADFVKLSFLFALIGYGTKAGLAPFHTWLPDGHGEAPFPVSALLSGVLLKCALYAILRFYTITTTTLAAVEPDSEFPARILLVAGLVSLGLAIPLILKENRFKRVLAYHSLEHMGIIAFGLGIGSGAAVFGALLHVLNHGVIKAFMFLAYGIAQSNYARAVREGKEVTGVLHALPGTGKYLALMGLALVGSPPFSIFFSKFAILWAAFSEANRQSTFFSIVPVILFLFSLTLIFAGLMRHLTRILLGNPPDGVRQERFRQLWPLFALFLLTLLFGVTVPHQLFGLPDLLQESVQIVLCGAPQCP